MQWVPVAQAVTTLKLGPLRPNVHRDVAGGHVDDDLRDENGETRSGPCHQDGVDLLDRVMPPMPEPMTQPKSSASVGVITIPESSIAIRLAATANCTKRSALRASFFSM